MRWGPQAHPTWALFARRQGRRDRLDHNRIVAVSQRARVQEDLIVLNPCEDRRLVLPQALAMEVLPLLDSTSETRRIVYGKVSSVGMIGSGARSARAPWPISRRAGPRMGFVSPTEKGGKL